MRQYISNYKPTIRLSFTDCDCSSVLSTSIRNRETTQNEQLLLLSLIIFGSILSGNESHFLTYATLNPISCSITDVYTKKIMCRPGVSYPYFMDMPIYQRYRRACLIRHVRGYRLHFVSQVCLEAETHSIMLLG